MKDCKRYILMFDEAICGDLSVEERRGLENHLKICKHCSDEFKVQEQLFGGIREEGFVEPEDEFWGNFNHKLHERMVSEGVLEGRRRAGFLNRITGFFMDLLSYQRVIQGASALGILVVGVFIGAYFFDSADIERVTPVSGADSIPKEGNRSLLVQTRDFLERSKVILLGIDNFDIDTEFSEAIDITYQQKVSRKLLNQAKGLKQRLEKSKSDRLKELINDLEVILMQIANIESTSELETIKLVQGNSYIHGILYRIRINDLKRSINKTDKI